VKRKEIKELIGKTTEELEKTLNNWQKELVEIRLKLKTERIKNFHGLSDKRHDIARIKTVISQKKLLLKNPKGEI